MIRVIPRYRPLCALLNQFCSLLSTSTSMSLRLNSTDLLLPLETFSTEDNFIKFWAPARSFLHFAPNYPSTVSKTFRSWCKALMAFYQTSLLPLCNVFWHVYEKSLKWLEIDNISFVSKHEPKSSDKFFRFHLQMDACHQQICSGHDLNLKIASSMYLSI